MDLKNRVAVITGGSKGYGKGIARVLKGNGCRVWILSSNEGDLKKAAEEIGVNCCVCDITIPQDWDAAFDKIVGKEKTIDLLVNNAGAGIAIKNLVEQTDDEIYRSIMINLTGHIYGIRRAAKLMIAQKNGIIINISSVCADHAWPGWSIYSAAKAGIEMLARSLHNEFRTSNVKITTLTPSWGSTNFLKSAKLKDWTKDITEKVMQPDQMGELIVKICTLDDHLYIPKIRVQPMVQEINPM
ncbi:MAG: SDR family oxidoreductase [Actinobacteria bacterium]|nr:SDR family oxidoreductase [Actinomycetota bacterium]